MRQGFRLGGTLRTIIGRIAVLVILAAVVARADDWPEIRGKGRLGVWNESGILEKFPESGLKVLWRTPIKGGFSGPSVVDGRVFVMDFTETQRPRGTERALALDERTGEILWTREWRGGYPGLSYSLRPRPPPAAGGRRGCFARAARQTLFLDA